MTTNLVKIIYSLPVCFAAGCLAGPGFMQQSGKAPIPTLNVRTVESGGITSAALVPSTKETQVVTAGDGSAVSGAAVTFPPGSIAIATSISISQGEQLANDAVTTQLNLGTQVTAAAQPVLISSSATVDAAKPFTVALPIPATSSLALDGGFANLIVLYHVKRAGEGSADYVGAFTRDQIKIVSGYAQVSTLYFGTYQAVYTQSVVTQAVQAVAAAPAAVGTDSQLARNIYFIRGPAAASFGRGVSSGGLQGWVPQMSRTSVSAGATLSNRLISTIVYGE